MSKTTEKLNENDNTEEFLNQIFVDPEHGKNNSLEFLESGSQLSLNNQESGSMMISRATQNAVALSTAQSIDTGTSSDQVRDRRDKKRQSDREYRSRIKEKHKKMEEDYGCLVNGYATLEEQLKDASAKIVQLESRHGGQGQQSVRQEYCRMTLELNYSNIEAKAEALKIVGGLPGVTEINMDINKKRLTLRGEDLDVVLVLNELGSICSTKLLSYNVETPRREEKKEEKKDYKKAEACNKKDEAYIGHTSPYWNYRFSHPEMIQAPYDRERRTLDEFKKIAAISLLVLIILVFGRYAY